MDRPASSERRRARQKGSTILEMGICIFSFLLLTFGAIDFGLGVYAYSFCYYAARDATRWASVHGTNSATVADCSGNPGIAGGCAAIQSDVASRVSNRAVGLDTSNLLVTATWVPGAAPGNEVTVNVQYTYAPISALGWKDTLTFSSSSEMEMVH